MGGNVVDRIATYHSIEKDTATFSARRLRIKAAQRDLVCENCRSWRFHALQQFILFCLK